MKNIFIEKSRFPKFLVVLFWLQFIFFLLYYISKKDTSLLIFVIGILVLGLLFTFSYAKLEMSKNSIKYGLSPFSSNKISWENIEQQKVVNISALSDFLGWGIRYSKKFGWSYIMGGDYAICFTLKSGKKKTFSIKDEKKLKAFLENINS